MNAIKTFIVSLGLFFHPINDITTDFKKPPQFESILKSESQASRDLAYPRHFEDIQRKLYPEIQALRLRGAFQEIFLSLLHRAHQENWEILLENAEAGRMEVVATTKWLKFKDDVVLEMRPQKKDVIEIHMRSKSRVGKSDLGANAKRIHNFLGALKTDWENKHS